MTTCLIVHVINDHLLSQMQEDQKRIPNIFARHSHKAGRKFPGKNIFEKIMNIWWVDKWMDGQMDGWKNGKVDGWMDWRMDIA